MNPSEQMINAMAQHSQPNFDKTKTALICIDLVNDGSDENGFFKRVLNYDISLLQRIEPNVIKLIAAAKQNYIPVIGVQAIYDLEYISPAMKERFEAMGIKGSLAPKGAWGSDIIPKIKGTGLDLIIIKSHYSAFAPERTFGFRPGNKAVEDYLLLPADKDEELESKGIKTMKDYFHESQIIQRDVDSYLKSGGVVSLDNYLKSKGISTLIITGASTHVCVDSTLAAASERGYKLFEPIDAVAAEGIPGEGFQRHFTYLSNHGLFKSELTTAEKILQTLQK